MINRNEWLFHKDWNTKATVTITCNTWLKFMNMLYLQIHQHSSSDARGGKPSPRWLLCLSLSYLSSIPWGPCNPHLTTIWIISAIFHNKLHVSNYARLTTPSSIQSWPCPQITTPCGHPFILVPQTNYINMLIIYCRICTQDHITTPLDLQEKTPKRSG